MKLLLENWREYLNEITTLDSELKQGFAEAIEDSQFWTLPNAEDDVDIGNHPDEMETPASEALRIALNEKAQELDTDLYFIVTVSNVHVLSKDDPHGGYPSNWMSHGMYQGPQSGHHVIWIELRPLGDDYEISELNPSELIKKISRTINHEMVHYKQLKKQAESKGISEEDAWQQMIDDPAQLPQTSDRTDYLSRHPEVDAYAHEAAEELIDKYGGRRALQLIKQRDSDVVGVLADYREVFKDDRETMKKFLKKLYSQIMSKEQ